MRKDIFHGVAIIPESFYKNGIFIVFLLTVGALFDLFSLATFIPLIILVISPTRTMENKYFLRLYEMTGVESPTSFAIILTVAALLIIFFKTQFHVWITFKKASYSYRVAADFASRAMAKYLDTPYLKFTNIDYAKEMNRISNLPIVFANNYLIPLGTILSESLILLMLLVSVMVFDVKVALFIVAIILPVAFLYQAKRAKMRKLGQQIKQTYPLLLKYTLQAIEGLPEIRVFKKESFFKKRVKDTFADLGVTFSKDHTALTTSVRLTELVATLCVSVLIVYALLSKQSLQQSILLLSIYAGVSFRAIPSVNRILAASLQLRTHEYIIPELQQMMAPKDISFDVSELALPFREKIEIQNLSFRYDNGPWILNEVSVTIRKGEKVAILGKSGSGKTTLFLLMMKFLKGASGSIKVDDTNIVDDNSHGWQKLIGYVPQNPYILDAPLIENIAFGIPSDTIDKERVGKLLQKLDLEEWALSLPQQLETIIGEKGAKLSGGQRQRIAIARALYHNAEILLLDEVTNQLDRETEHDVIQILYNLASLNKTVVLITHRIELWKFFDTVYELKEKRLERMYTDELQSIVKRS